MLPPRACWSKRIAVLGQLLELRKLARISARIGVRPTAHLANAAELAEVLDQVFDLAPPVSAEAVIARFCERMTPNEA